MLQFLVSLLAEIEISGIINISAISKKEAEILARKMHSRTQVRWEYQGQSIGAYNGPHNRMWMVETNPNEFQVSLTDRISISSSLTILARNSQEAVEQAKEVHSQGLSSWTFGKVQIAYAGGYAKIWALPNNAPLPPSITLEAPLNKVFDLYPADYTNTDQSFGATIETS